MPGKHARQAPDVWIRPRPRKTQRVSAQPMPLTFWKAIRQSLHGVLQDFWQDSFLPWVDRSSFALQRHLRALPGRIRNFRSRLQREWVPSLAPTVGRAIRRMAPRFGDRNHVAFKTWTGISAMVMFVTTATPANAVTNSDLLAWSVIHIDTQSFRVPVGFAEMISRQKYEIVDFYNYPGKGNRYFKQWLAEDQPTVDDLVRRNRNVEFDRFEASILSLTAVGIPYVFGGDSPLGFDCSGFVRHIYAHYGISLPHSVSAIDRIGKTVSAAKAEAGDLVIWNDDSHMGIYIGANMIVHAPRPGSRVEYRELWDSNVHFVRISK
jgi:hypothetical protein